MDIKHIDRYFVELGVPQNTLIPSSEGIEEILCI